MFPSTLRRARSRSASSLAFERPAPRSRSSLTRRICSGVGPMMGAWKQRPHAREDRRGGLAGELLVDDRLGQRHKQARRGLQLHRERADRVDEPRHAPGPSAQMRHAPRLVEAERAVALKERRRGRGLPAFDRQQAQLRRDPAAGREAAQAAAGSEHAMTGHDDQKGIPAQRLAHGTRQAATSRGGPQSRHTTASRPAGWFGRRRRRACGTPARRPCRAAARDRSTWAPPSTATMALSASWMPAGGGASRAPGCSRSTRARVSASRPSGNCTPRIPPGPHAMAQRPMAVSKTANSGAVMADLNRSIGSCSHTSGSLRSNQEPDDPETSHARHPVVAGRWYKSTVAASDRRTQ